MGALYLIGGIELLLLEVWTGPKGQVLSYVRPTGRCPAAHFLESICPAEVRAKFEGTFAAVTKMGDRLHFHERFTLLRGNGKPLWEFKQHAHRLYCLRIVTNSAGSVKIILLSGWKKDKAGKGRNEEGEEIKKAQRLREEYEKRVTGGVK